MARSPNDEEIPTHIQSYWHVYRRRLVSSQAFHEYWEKMPQWKDYAQVTRQHEMRFTRRFEQLGFTWSTYIDPEKYAGYSPYPLLYMPMELIRDSRCPIFKRRCLFVDYSVYQDQTAGQPALELFDYLRDHTTYDTDLIWDTLLRSYNVADLQRTMHLDYTLPKDALLPPARRTGQGHPSDITGLRSPPPSSSTSISWISCPRPSAISPPDPRRNDLYITSTKDKIDQIRRYVADNGFAHPRRIFPSRIAAVTCRRALRRGIALNITSGKYEVVGFAHDKKSTQVTASGPPWHGITGICFSNCWRTRSAPRITCAISRPVRREPAARAGLPDSAVPCAVLRAHAAGRLGSRL